jgi:hypothetical protein
MVVRCCWRRCESFEVAGVAGAVINGEGGFRWRASSAKSVENGVEVEERAILRGLMFVSFVVVMGRDGTFVGEGVGLQINNFARWSFALVIRNGKRG